MRLSTLLTQHVDLKAKITSPILTITMTSDTETGNKLAEKSVFTEREEALLKIAWNCLKTAPEVCYAHAMSQEVTSLTETSQIDYEKFQVAGGFNTMKTTQNTWGKIKKKLVTAPDGVESPGGPSKYCAFRFQIDY